MQVVFLGTNGWYDTHTGNTVCILVKSEKYHIIFDAGNGLYKIDDYCSAKKPAYLFLSHFHLDHIVGLHTLNKVKCFKKLHIYGPAGSKKILRSIINSPFTVPFSKLSFTSEIYELPEEEKKLPFHIDSKPLLHSSLTLGFRVELNGKVISYCPDTGYCENAVELSKNADLLIADCAYKNGQQSRKWPHLNPETAARIAVEAGAKKLALVHFDANIYKRLKERKGAEKMAQKIFKAAFSSADNLTVVI